jgi:hypothetical protein
MAHFNTVFNQLLDFIPRHDFEQFVHAHEGDKYSKKLSCWQQFTCLLYAQATNKDSLRDIARGLKLHSKKWYHLGIETVAKSTLADANRERSAEIYQKLFYELLKRCKEFSVKREFTFKEPVYLLDGSVISLCLKLFPWSRFGQKKGGLKIHCLLSLERQIPEIVVLTEQKFHELKIAEEIDFKRYSDSWFIFDRGYIKYSWWKKLNDHRIKFITRTRTDTNCFVLGQLIEPKDENGDGVLKDEKIALFGEQGLKEYPEDLRLVTYRDPETKKIYKFITNDFDQEAQVISDLYKARWDIESFFRWIKQNLVIKSFLGTSKNAVMSQIWIAMIYLLLIYYIKHQTGTNLSISDLCKMIDDALLMPLTLIDLLQLNPENARIVLTRASPKEQLTLC